MHSVAHFYPYLTYKMFLLDGEVENSLVKEIFKLFGLCLLVDLVVNPIQMMENRYVLQNNLPDFKIFRRPVKAMRKALFTG